MNRYLEKIASQLRPHHERALEKLDENDGIIAHHSTGSGKTRLFLEAIRRQQQNNKRGRALIVAPASLVSNVDKEIEKHKVDIDRDRLDVYSYEKATRIADQLRKNHYAIAVADEAHKLRNVNSKRTKELSDIIGSADKRVLATATANYNHLADLSPLVNIAAGEKLLPEDRKEVENRYLQKVKKSRGIIEVLTGTPAEEETRLSNTKELAKAFKKHVHFYDAKDDLSAADKFPTQSEETIEVPMSKAQSQVYRYVEGNLPFMLRMKVRHNLPMDQKEKAQLNSFSTGVRQASNSIRHMNEDRDSVEYTPKIAKAIENLKARKENDKNFRGVVYSNYLDAGIREYSRKLTKEKIPHHVYTGELSKTEKDQIVKDYNEGRKPVLLISSSGAEGLDLKGTKLTQVLEPHFNPSKIKQVIGRGARYESHAHLPSSERHMHVEHYLTTHSKPLFGKAPHSIDKYLSEHSDGKDEIFEQVRDLMRKHAN